MPDSSPDRYLQSFRVVPDSPQMQKDFLYVLVSLFSKSADPAAAHVIKVAQANGILPVGVNNFQEYPGRGMGGLITLPNEKNPRAVLLGSVEFLAQCRMQCPALLETTVGEWLNDDASVSVAGWDGWIRGVLKFRPHS